MPPAPRRGRRRPARRRRTQNQLIAQRKQDRDRAVHRAIGLVTDDDPFTVLLRGTERTGLLMLDSYRPMAGDRVWISWVGSEVPLVHGAIDDVGDIPEAVHAPTFATGWSNFGGTYSNAGYYKDRDRVYLRGAVKNGGTGTSTIFNLPAGYRPPADVVKRISLFNGSGDLLIKANGDVVDNTFNAGTSKVTTFLAADFRV